LNRNTKRFAISVGLLLFILTYGTVGFYFLSDGKNSLLDCFYMTFITITTIGYGELLTFSNLEHARIFILFLAATGIGAFTYILSNITAFVISDELLKNYKERKMKEIIKKLENHYLICGSGDIGHRIAEELKETKRSFILIDKEIHQDYLAANPDLLFLHGDATDEEILTDAGIEKAKGLFAVTGDDNYNLVITFTAKQLNNNLRIISKIRDIKNGDKIKKAGADSVISPYNVGGLRIVSEMVRPTVVSFLDTMLRDKDKSLRIEEIIVPEKVVGRKISSLNMNIGNELLLIALKTKEDWLFNPDDSTTLSKDDVLIVMTTPEAKLKIEKLIFESRD
jgi:voltage-gated potassium channel